MEKSILLLMGVAVTLISYAQPKDHREKDPVEIAAHKTEKMKSHLDLNDEQYASVKKINEKYAEKMSALRKDDEGKEEKRTQFQALRDQHVQEVNALLTPEQQQKWKTIRDEKQEKRKEHRQKKIEGRKQELKTALSLSDTQEKQLQAARESFKTKIKTLREDSNLGEADKKQKIDAVKAEHENTVKGILTPEQFTKWKEMRDDKKDHHHSRRKQ